MMFCISSNIFVLTKLWATTPLRSVLIATGKIEERRGCVIKVLQYGSLLLSFVVGFIINWTSMTALLASGGGYE
jgi:hypothetical protein